MYCSAEETIASPCAATCHISDACIREAPESNEGRGVSSTWDNKPRGGRQSNGG